MSESKQTKASVCEITTEDIPEVALFLNRHMNDKFSPDTWASTLTPKWPTKASNCGYMLKNSDGEVVGAICALYSEQLIGGKRRQMCNLHSWAVIPQYRTKSIMLILAAIRQKNFHFTMFTPNESGLEIFSYLKFKPLNDTLTPLLNIPLSWPGEKVRILEPVEYSDACFSPWHEQVFTDHADLPWIHRLVYKHEDSYCFILFRTARYKRLPSIRVLYMSDRDSFFKCWPTIRSHLILRHRYATTIIESRFVNQKHPLSLPPFPGQKTFYFSDTLGVPDIECIYSELTVMDL